MEFDGKETVWCPVGDFFGSGIGLHPLQGWYRTVRAIAAHIAIAHIIHEDEDDIGTRGRAETGNQKR